MGQTTQKIIDNLKQLLTIPPVIIDGGLYAAVALFMFLGSQFGTDEAAKYVSPVTLFWLRTFIGSLSATALALKLFRSTSFADSKQENKVADWNKSNPSDKIETKP